MTLQWTAVALFLYAEIAVNLILCIPFISARRWRSVFSWRIWNWLSPYWNKCFFTMIMVLIILFLDAVREVHKYSGPEPMQDAKVNPTVYDNVHMKLFRAQRNLYISGFSLFLWLLVGFFFTSAFNQPHGTCSVKHKLHLSTQLSASPSFAVLHPSIMRRVVTLLNQLAVTMENSAGLQAQVDGAVKAAKRHQDDNLALTKALLDEEKTTSVKKQQLKLEAEKLADQVKAAEEAVRKSHAEVEAMRRQAKGLAQEYDRLLSEHNQLQNLQSPTGKKDQ